MWKEFLKKAAELLSNGQQLKSIADIGTGDSADLSEYMLEREKFIEGVTEFLTDMPAGIEAEFTGINDTLKEMKKNLTEFSQPKKELTKKDVFHAIAKIAMFSIHGMSSVTSEESYKELQGMITKGGFQSEKGPERKMFMNKDAIETTLEPGGTNAGLTVNRIYERSLLKYAPEYSDMMPHVRRLPMLAPIHSFPALDSRGFVMKRTAATASGTTWTKANKIATAAVGPTFGARVEIKATTLAAYIPWIDEFRDDLQLNESLEALMSECFLEAYAEDFDRNVLVADSSGTDQYDGLLNTTGVLEYTLTASNILQISPDELNTALLKIPRVDRDGGFWILNESVLDALQKVRNANGDYMMWTPPTGDFAGKIANKPYIEAHLMPGYEEIEAGDTIMAYARPDNMWVGERAGLEVKKYEDTIYGLENEEIFTRWRLRNGFKTVKPAACLKVNLKN